MTYKITHRRESELEYQFNLEYRQWWNSEAVQTYLKNISKSELIGVLLNGTFSVSYNGIDLGLGNVTVSRSSE